MRSVELSEEVKNTIEMAQSRIMGVGRDQYEDEDTVQKFENRTIEDLMQNVREEIIDLINWSVMLDIMVQRWIAGRKG